MRFVTFNLRCDHGQDGNNCFVFRQPLILEAIAENQPDVMCFQEVLPHMAKWLKDSLPEYYVVGCGRGERLDSEQMTIAIRRDRYDLLEMHTYWLSDTPEVPGSLYPGQSDNPRICTEAILMEEGSGQLYRVVNTHLDHVGAEARRRGLLQILGTVPRVEAFAQAPMILAGDFNAQPEDPEMAPLFEDPSLRVITTDVGFTYHGYGKAERPSLIDYIVLRGALSCEKVWKWTTERNGVYLSDHYPVCCDLSHR